MRRLYLLRHAKSSWELAGELDWERGLLPRGRDDAQTISLYMRQQEIVPDFVICSSARRTKETLEALGGAIPDEAAVEVTDDAYQATTATLLKLVRSVEPAARAVLLIGHNPAVHDLAVELASGGADLERMAAKFPTCALAEFEIGTDWSEVGPGCAPLRTFVTPKEL